MSSIFCFGKFGAFINDNSKMKTVCRNNIFKIFCKYCKSSNIFYSYISLYIVIYRYISLYIVIIQYDDNVM